MKILDNVPESVEFQKIPKHFVLIADLSSNLRLLKFVDGFNRIIVQRINYQPVILNV